MALAFLGVSGLGIAVADPDIRADVARVADWVLLTNVFSGAVFSGLVIVLRRWELDLRSEASPAPKVRRYSRLLHLARLVVIWLAVVQAAALMLVIR